MNLTAPGPDTEAGVGRVRRAWRSRTAFRLSALLVVAAVVVAAAAGIVEVTGDDDDPRPARPAGGAPAVPAPPAATTDTDPSVPTTPFPVDWEVFQTVAFPVGGSTYGPAVRRPDGLVAGWAHTPRGAVLAALNIDARVMLAPEGQWQVLLDATMQPGPGRDLIASYRRQASGPIVAPEGGFEQIAGFRVVTYTPDVAVVSIASQRSAQDLIQVTTATVRWADGDWKLQLQADGSQSPYATTIPDLASAGFVPLWAPR